MGRKAGQTGKAYRSRGDGERIKARNLTVLVSSDGGLTSLPTCDPKAQCWLSRTTKQFTPYLLRWPRISQKRCSEPGWLRTDTARCCSSQNIYCEAHTVWEEAERTFLLQTLVGPAYSAVGLCDSPGDLPLISAGIYLPEPASPLAFQ